MLMVSASVMQRPNGDVYCVGYARAGSKNGFGSFVSTGGTLLVRRWANKRYKPGSRFEVTSAGGAQGIYDKVFREKHAGGYRSIPDGTVDVRISFEEFVTGRHRWMLMDENEALKREAVEWVIGAFIEVGGTGSDAFALRALAEDQGVLGAKIASAIIERMPSPEPAPAPTIIPGWGAWA